MIVNDRFFKFEMLILAILSQHDASSEELLASLQSQNILNIKEGQLLTSLYFFLESHLISKYDMYDDIYYHIEKSGLVRLNTLKRQYQQTTEAIEVILNHEK